MRIMNIGLCALSILLIGTQADAQNTSTTTSNSTSGANAVSSSGSAASNQGNRQSINFNSPANTTSTNNSTLTERVSGGTSNTTTLNGDQTVRFAPTVYAPPVSGGNPCTVGISTGVSAIGFGVAAGGTFVDQDCADRQKVAMIHNAGYTKAAKELMCNDRKTYDAFKTAGEPCAVREQWEPKVLPGAMPARPVPIVQPAPAPQVMIQPPQPKTYPRCNARMGIVDECIGS